MVNGKFQLPCDLPRRKPRKPFSLKVFLIMGTVLANICKSINAWLNEIHKISCVKLGKVCKTTPSQTSKLFPR